MTKSIDSKIQKIKSKIEILKHNYSRCGNIKIAYLIAIEQIKIKEFELLKEERLLKQMMLSGQLSSQAVINYINLLIK